MEKFQPMKDAPLKQCPACKRRTLRRKVGGGAGLIFKGTGFYITDYKKKSGSKSDSDAVTPVAKTDETKPAVKTTTSETKPAASAPTK